MASEITTTVQTGNIKRLGTYVHGDIGWIDHGGALLVTCDEDPDNAWLEVVVPLQAYDSSMDPIWEVYRVDLDTDMLDWANLAEVSSCVGIPVEDLQASLAAEDPRERVGAICAIGEYYGFGELDPYHLNLDPKEVRERYPDEDPVFDCDHEADLQAAEIQVTNNDTLAIVVFTCKRCATKGELELDLDDIDWQ